MGFEYNPKLRKLIFEDPEMAGLEARVKLPAMAVVLKVASMQGARVDADGFKDLVADFADCLVEWNLEKKGEPVPPTLEGLLEQDQDLLIMLVDAWQSGLAGVDAPLETPSRDGEPSLVASIPMAPLSESQAS